MYHLKKAISIYVETDTEVVAKEALRNSDLSGGRVSVAYIERGRANNCYASPNRTQEYAKMSS